SPGRDRKDRRGDDPGGGGRLFPPHAEDPARRGDPIHSRRGPSGRDLLPSLRVQSRRDGRLPRQGLHALPVPSKCRTRLPDPPHAAHTLRVPLRPFRRRDQRMAGLLKITFLTTDDPVYLPAFYRRVLERWSNRTEAVYVVPPLYRRQTPAGAALRYART